MIILNQFGMAATEPSELGYLSHLFSAFKRRPRIVDQFGRKIESVIPAVGKTLNVRRPPRFKTAGT